MFPYRDSQPHDDEFDSDAAGIGAPGGPHAGSAVTGITPGGLNPGGLNPGGMDTGARHPHGADPYGADPHGADPYGGGNGGGHGSDHGGEINLGASVLSSGADEDSGPGRPRFEMPGGASGRTHPAALGLTVVGFFCLLASFVLPWLSVVGGTTASPPGARERNGLYLSEISIAWTPLGWSVLLALVVATIVGGARLRRPMAGAALGWAAGQLGIMVGMAGDVSRGGGLYSPFSERGVETTAGVGLYAGFAGVLLLGTAALLLLRPPRPGRAREPEPEPDDGPLDLTVTPLPPPAWGREGTA